MTQTDRGLRVVLQREQHAQRFEIWSSAALLGSAAHCDIRLTTSEAAQEQLLLRLHGAEIIAVAKAARPECSLDGLPFRAGTIASGTRLCIGPLQVQVELMQPAAAGVPRDAGYWLRKLGVVVALGLVLASYQLRKSSEARPLEQTVTAELGLGAALRACPDPAVAAARQLAADALQAARAKRERSLFDASEGVRALALYDRAAVCAEHIQDGDLSSQARAEASSLTQRLRDTQRVRHLRLLQLIEQQRYAQALLEVQHLMQLSTGPELPYARWLAAVQRELTVRSLEQAKS